MVPKAMRGRYLVCLGGGLESVPMLQRVKAAGLKVALVDANGHCPGFDLADTFSEASCYDAGETVAALTDYRGLGNLAGVMCCAVDAPFVAARVAEAYGLKALAPTAAAYGSNKLSQVARLSGRGLRIPAWGVLKSTNDLADACGKWERVICKPVDSRGGRGVTLCEAHTPVRFFDWHVETARSASPSRTALWEEFLDGPQLSTESVIVNGSVRETFVARRHYHRLGEFAPFVIEDGCRAPYLPFAGAVYAISRLIECACRTLGWDNMTVKGDLVIHSGAVYIIELAARLSGGFLASHIIPTAYGYDMVGAAVALAVGDPEGLARCYRETPDKTFVSQRYLFPERTDVGRAVEEIIPPEVRGGAFATYNIQAGDVIQPVTSHPARLGQATATGATAGEADALAGELVRWMGEGVRYGFVE